VFSQYSKLKIICNSLGLLAGDGKTFCTEQRRNSPSKTCVN